jgi:hypothetical protein
MEVDLAGRQLGSRLPEVLARLRLHSRRLGGDQRQIGVDLAARAFAQLTGRELPSSGYQFARIVDEAG